jgi:GNAT superfamily N-acetyltransferase
VARRLHHLTDAGKAAPRVASAGRFRVRAARPEELAGLGELYERASFGARLARTAGFARARLGGAVVVAEVDGDLAGVAAGAVFGATGWVGGVAVVPERRRAGLGGALTEAVLAHLEGSGVATVLLHATDLGRPVYERLGFRAEARYPSLPGPPLPRTGPPPGRRGPWTTGRTSRPGVWAARVGDLEAVVALDRAATGEDRRRLLAALWPAGGLVAGHGGVVRGFHLPAPWRPGGATLADDPETGLALLDAARRTDAAEVSVSLPEQNTVAVEALAAAGFRERFRTVRMHRGPAVSWRPATQFGAHTLFWG